MTEIKIDRTCGYQKEIPAGNGEPAFFLCSHPNCVALLRRLSSASGSQDRYRIMQEARLPRGANVEFYPDQRSDEIYPETHCITPTTCNSKIPV